TVTLKEREAHESKKSDIEKSEGVNDVTKGESKMVKEVKSRICVQEIPRASKSQGDKHLQIIKDVTLLIAMG
ncbi:hypothetical protein TNCT_617521, partial [Trichonephila clavata]